MRKKVLEFFKVFLSLSYVRLKDFPNLCEAFQIRIETLMGNNIGCQRLECYYRSFYQGRLNNLKERPLIRKDRISKFQNCEKISEREKSLHFRV